MGIALPGMSMSGQFFQALMAQGGSRMGTQGIMTCLEKFNNMEVKKY